MRKQENTTPALNTPPNMVDLMMSIPKMYCNKSVGLLQYLQSDQDVKWDEQGHLYIAQQKVDNSLILDFRIRKKAARPYGWHELSSHLTKRYVPTELIGNPEWFTPPGHHEKARGIKRDSLFLPYTKLPTRKVLGAIFQCPSRNLGKIKSLVEKNKTVDLL